VLAAFSICSAEPTPVLRPGVVEFGVAGSLHHTEGATRATVSLRGGSFLSAGPGLFGFEGEAAYSRIRELDRLDLLGNVSWSLKTKSPAYPFAAMIVGVRQEWLGSFRNSLVPIGGSVGVRALMGSKAALRVEYRIVRFLDDPIPDFTEHQVLLGISLLLRNGDDRSA
jgi:hypothetical protein